jgi:hypothetical protein
MVKTMGQAMKNPTRDRQRGSTILEMAIVVPALTLLFFGVTGLGIMLGRYIQAVQVCRDVAHMYSDGIDFSLASNQNIIIQQLASGTGITATGGNGTILLSKISTVYQGDCNANGFAATCNNLNLPVFTQRIVIGDPALRTSYFGTPSAGILDTSGNITSSVYMKNLDSSVRTVNYVTLLTDAMTRAGVTIPNPPQPDDEVAYVVEIYFKYPDISFLGWSTAGGAYSRFIFRGN